MSGKKAPVPLSIECPVCRAPAPDHLHFGGHCCYSCRAFFRRTVQRIEKKGLKKCKTGLQSCPITTDGKSCIHCRYTRCLQNGMNPAMMKGKRKKDPDDHDRDDEEDEDKTEDDSPSTSSMPRQDSNRDPTIPHSSYSREQSLFVPGPSSSFPRPSVISFSGNHQHQINQAAPNPNLGYSYKDELFLMKSESEILRHEGNAMISTGSLLTKQAELLDFYAHRAEQVATQNRGTVFRKAAPSIKHLYPDPPNIEIDKPIDFSEKPITERERDDFCLPIFSSMEKFKTSQAIDQILKDTLNEIEKYPNWGSYPCTPVIKEEDVKHELMDCEEAPDYNVNKNELMATPYLKLTIEESKSIDKLFKDTRILLKRTCPVSLYQARIGVFLNTLGMEGMLNVFTNARKAQNNYHFLTMFSIPYFEDLTTRAQNCLIEKNMIMCHTLNQCVYFFGHTAVTAIGQEKQTQLETGLGDYIMANAPQAASLPAAKYEDYFRRPWAKTPDFEDRHHRLSEQIGTSMIELGYVGYILMYGISLYSVDEDTLSNWNIPERDKSNIRHAANCLEILYSRFCKKKIGWKKASFNCVNQKYILQQLDEALRIFTKENLEITNDFSNTDKLDPKKIAENRI